MYPGAERCLCRGLSRMRGNSHVRFLGGGGVAMRCCYPTIIVINCAARPSEIEEFICNLES